MLLAICGFKNSGKTTLLEAVISTLVSRGLAVAVIKHDAHGISVDHPGKDSDRLFRTGATVVLRGPNEGLSRSHEPGRDSLHDIAAALLREHDLVLVEGHKSVDVPKVWLKRDPEDVPPDSVRDVQAELEWGPDRAQQLLAFLEPWLQAAWRARPILGGILIGGQSSRMGHPKHLIKRDGQSWLARTMAALAPHTQQRVLLGTGELPTDDDAIARDAIAACPRLSDVRGVAGPMAGMLAAMRWAPDAAWIFLACDMALATVDAVAWLVAQRAPGIWAIVPRTERGPHPLLALYEPPAHAVCERGVRANDVAPIRIAGHAKAITPEPPRDLQTAWRNVNSPADLAALDREHGDQPRSDPATD